MLEDLMKEIEQMSDAEKQALLNTQFPEELSKQAEAEVNEALLADSLYAYGWLSAERAVAEIDGLDKVAKEQLDAHMESEKEVGEQIEQALGALEIADSEDEVALHKTAQACAALIFEGYSDCLEKIAKKEKMLDKVKGMASAANKKLKAHRGKAGVAAGLAAGYAGKKVMDKKASEMTLGQIVETINGVSEIEQGVEKLAAKGGAKAKALMEGAQEALAKGKKVLKAHRGKAGLAAGAMGGALLASKKD